MKQLLVALIALFFMAGLQAASRSPSQSDLPLPAPQDPIQQQRYVGHLTVSSVPELEDYLNRVEQDFQKETSDGPVVLVLHGQEINSFIVDNYARYQSVVEKSTDLTARGYVQIEICERWLDSNNVERYRLQPFVKTVQNGPARIRELRQQNYTYF